MIYDDQFLLCNDDSILGLHELIGILRIKTVYTDPTVSQGRVKDHEGLMIVFWGFYPLICTKKKWHLKETQNCVQGTKTRKEVIVHDASIIEKKWYIFSILKLQISKKKPHKNTP